MPPGPLHRFEAEPPFLLLFPKGGVGQSWQRNFDVTLAPPHGTGEKYPAVQAFTVKSDDGLFATFELKTVFKKLPKSPLDRVPLFQKQRKGMIVFDHRHGRLHSGNLHLVREIENHQGTGSRYRFESTYKEE